MEIPLVSVSFFCLFITISYQQELSDVIECAHADGLVEKALQTEAVLILMESSKVKIYHNQ